MSPSGISRGARADASPARRRCCPGWDRPPFVTPDVVVGLGLLRLPRRSPPASSAPRPPRPSGERAAAAAEEGDGVDDSPDDSPGGFLPKRAPRPPPLNIVGER